jgi:hypothetical protein
MAPEDGADGASQPPPLTRPFPLGVTRPSPRSVAFLPASLLEWIVCLSLPLLVGSGAEYGPPANNLLRSLVKDFGKVFRV